MLNPTGHRCGTFMSKAREPVSRHLWCVDCVCDNAELLHRWVYRGLATSQGGALKVEFCCTGCRQFLTAGTYAEAITLHRPGQRFEHWESDIVLQRR